MGPPNDGNHHLPFVDLIALEKVDETTYRSTALPFSPGGSGRAYGGHVYAQAVWAAAQTVQADFVVHNVTGFFTLAGVSSIPFVYRVQTIRDGRSYCTRSVNVTQAEGEDICFTCTCSFKKSEESHLDVQEDINLEKQYQVVLGGKKPEDWEHAPGMDVPWYTERRQATGENDVFPGLEARKVDMARYNAVRTPFDRRQLIYYRAIGELPLDPNLHACVHLYASDRNSLYIVANHLDMGDRYTGLASLSHSVVFHCLVSQLLLQNSERGDKPWFCKEDWTNRAAGGRGMHLSRIIGFEGTHVASTWQEGMVRVGIDLNEQEIAYKKIRGRL